ncbi:MAG: hypothetical protein MUF22_06440 [Chitinispirillaceae bacterium]|jgi:hypothetical protein|nr:hypothetical protein [Chitinispirillaceae bacterium]
MGRVVRIAAVVVAVVLVAWVIKEALGIGDGRKAEAMVRKMRLGGV